MQKDENASNTIVSKIGQVFLGIKRNSTVHITTRKRVWKCDF